LLQHARYMHRSLEQGCLGDKTPERGGFYRRDGIDVLVLDPKSGSHIPMVKPAPIEFVEQMKQLHRVGRYSDALKVFATQKAPSRTFAIGSCSAYVSYAA